MARNPFPSPSNSCSGMRLACNIPLVDSFPYQGRTKGGLRCVLPNASR
jgi:hypothetical protein